MPLRFLPLVIVDAGETDQALPGLPDDAGLGALVVGARDDLVFGLVGVEAPQILGAVEGDARFADLEVHMPGGLALDDDDFVARLGELRREVAPRVALAVSAGERRDEEETVAVAAQHGGPGHGSDGEDELGLGLERLDLRAYLFAEIVGTETLGADESFDELRRHGLFAGGAGSEVDAE
jgi:hypothetical protein